MSRNALKLLKDARLLNSDGSVSDSVGRLSDTELAKILEYYSNRRAQDAEQEIEQHRSKPKELSPFISSISGRSTPQALLASALVASKIYVNDPLAELGLRHAGRDSEWRRSAGMDPEFSPTRGYVRSHLSFFSALAPLIDDGIIVALPLWRMRMRIGGPATVIPLGSIEPLLPENVRALSRNVAVIRDAKFSQGGCVVGRPATGAAPQLAVGFAGEETLAGYTVFSGGRAIFTRGSGGALHPAIRWAAKPHGPWDWRSQPSVTHCVDYAVLQRLESIEREVLFARRLGGYYLTDSPFEAALCGLSVQDADVGVGVAAVRFMNVILPCLKNANAAEISRLRNYKPEIFYRLQASIIEIVARLNGAGDDFERRALAIFETEIRPQIAEIERAARKVVKDALLTAGAALAIGIHSGAMLSVAGTLGTVGVAGLVGAGRLIPSISDYRLARNSPAFLWKQLVKR